MTFTPPPSLRRFGRASTPSAIMRSVSQVADSMASTLNDIVNKSSGTPIGAHSTKVVVSGASLLSDAVTAISWGSSIFDVDGMWASSPNPTRLTAITKGIYLIEANVQWAASVAGNVVMGLYLNGSLLSNDGARSLQAVVNWSQTESWAVALAVNDYVEVKLTRPPGTATSYTASVAAILTGTN